MTVSEAGSRFKAAAPYAAAGGAVIAVVAGGALLMTQPGPSSAPAAPELIATNGAPQVPGPGGLAGVQFDQAPAGGPPGAQAAMELVVKFKDDGKVKDIVDTFWKDQTAARAKFETFKAGRAELANLKLDRVTYSNELVLVHDGGAPPERRLAAMREIAARLKSVADISYAEPNMTAHPGGQ